MIILLLDLLLPKEPITFTTCGSTKSLDICPNKSIRCFRDQPPESYSPRASKSPAYYQQAALAKVADHTQVTIKLNQVGSWYRKRWWTDPAEGLICERRIW
jgi:hypothetical protein